MLHIPSSIRRLISLVKQLSTKEKNLRLTKSLLTAATIFLLSYLIIWVAEWNSRVVVSNRLLMYDADFRLEPIGLEGEIEKIARKIGPPWEFCINPIPLVVAFVVVWASKSLSNMKHFYEFLTATSLGLWTFTSSQFFSMQANFEQNILDLANEVGRNPNFVGDVGIYLFVELERRAESLHGIGAISYVATLVSLLLFFSLVLATAFPKKLDQNPVLRFGQMLGFSLLFLLVLWLTGFKPFI